MRKIIFAAALLAATPALAQPGYEREWDEPAEVALDPAAIDPAEVGRITDAMDRMVGAILDLPVGSIAAAIDPLGRGGVYPGDTMRDLAERDDPYAERRIRSSIRGTARGLGAMSESLNRIMPVLRQSIDQVSRDFEAAIEATDDGAPY